MEKKIKLKGQHKIDYNSKPEKETKNKKKRY